MQAFRAENYKVVIMKECDWNRKLQRISSTPTRMSRILLRDTEATLLNAIKEDSIFGFLVCSVETPQALIDEFEKVNWSAI